MWKKIVFCTFDYDKAKYLENFKTLIVDIVSLACYNLQIAQHKSYNTLPL